ncbi:exported protein [Granulicella sibirica]|uniref:Murein endopeptidase K n=2 Tax=Granulicella sibirica TaxID=2479048 RepID=A0A4Q0SZ88_9BACT|nr:exported protein [Granulicella sibirica]
MHRHPRLHALAHTFVNVALPGAGLLPDDAEDVPLEGLQYELKLAHAQTGEMIDVVYRIGDTYIPEALTQLDLFLRDSHNQEVNAYDPRTFDLLHTMLAKLGRTNGVVDILSGYRSQETNDALRASGTTNAAEHSQHISAKAIDLRVLGVPAVLLRDAALSLGVGGVGYYPKSQFVHVDTGPVREWTFAPHIARRHSRRSHRG